MAGRCRRPRRPQPGSAQSAELRRGPRTQPAKRRGSPANTRHRQPESPVGRITERWSEPGAWGFRIHSFLVEKRKPKWKGCTALSWQSRRTRCKRASPGARANLNCDGLPSVTRRGLIGVQWIMVLTNEWIQTTPKVLIKSVKAVAQICVWGLVTLDSPEATTIIPDL